MGWVSRPRQAPYRGSNAGCGRLDEAEGDGWFRRLAAAPGYHLRVTSLPAKSFLFLCSRLNSLPSRLPLFRSVLVHFPTLDGYPPSPRISEIIELAENSQIIYRAQSVAGKILSRRELAGRFYRVSLGSQLRRFDRRHSRRGHDLLFLNVGARSDVTRKRRMLRKRSRRRCLSSVFPCFIDRLRFSLRP